MLDVTDYGAVGDGSTDDTAAIQSAIDDASEGDTVYIPGTEDYYLLEYPHGGPGKGCLRVRGDRHADNITLKGDGASSELRLGNFDGNAFLLRIRPDSSGVQGLTVRDLKLHGRSDQQPASTDPNHYCIRVSSKDSSADPSQNDILIENVVGTKARGTAFASPYGGVRFNCCTARNTGSHCFTGADHSSDDDRLVWANCLAENCGRKKPGRYGFDKSGGYTVLENSVSKNNPQGSKVTPEHQLAIYRNFRVNGTRSARGIQRPTDKNPGQVVAGNMVIEDAVGGGMLMDVDAWQFEDGSTVLVKNSGAKKQVDVWASDGASLDAGNASLYIVDSGAPGAALKWASSGNGNLGAYYYDGNTGDNLSNNGNLSIGNGGGGGENGRIEDIDEVPKADEVGASF